MPEGLNWNLFNSIAQNSGYQNKVQARQQEMEYVARMEKRAEKRMNEQMLNQKAVNDEMEKISDLSALNSADVEKVQKVEREARKKVINGVAAANGDYKQFLIQGGFETLRDYKNSVTQSEEMRNGLYNKEISTMIQKDMATGKYMRSVKNYVIDDKGNEQEAVMTVAQQLQLYNEGRIKRLSYNGAQEGKSLKAMDFMKGYDPSNPDYSQAVTLDQYAEHLMAKGQDKEIAVQRAGEMLSHYEDRDGDGVKETPVTGFMWGTQGGMSYKTNGKKRDNLGKSKGNYKGDADKYLNWLSLTKERESVGEIGYLDYYVDNHQTKTERVHVDTKKISMIEKDKLASGFFKMKKNSDGSYIGVVQNAIGFQNLENGAVANLTGSEYEFESIRDEIKYIYNADGSIEGVYAVMDLIVPEEVMEEKLGEGVWNTEGKRWAAIDRDQDFDHPIWGDSRRITVGVNIPHDAVGQWHLDQAMEMKAGQNIVDVKQEQYYSVQQEAPKGVMKQQAGQQYAEIGGKYYEVDGYGGAGNFAEAQVNYYNDFNLIRETLIKKNQYISDADIHAYLQGLRK